MPIEHVKKTVLFDNLCVAVSAWRYICDGCGAVEAFHDIPTPYLEPEGPSVARDKGWRIGFTADSEICFCNGCPSVVRAMHDTTPKDGREMMSEWQDISTAPTDRPIQAKIPGHGSDNIIKWMDGFTDSDGKDCCCWVFVENQEPPDCWTDGVCWKVNSYGFASVKPTHWKDLPPSRPA